MLAREEMTTRCPCDPQFPWGDRSKCNMWSPHLGRSQSLLCLIGRMVPYSCNRLGTNSLQIKLCFFCPIPPSNLGGVGEKSCLEKHVCIHTRLKLIKVSGRQTKSHLLLSSNKRAHWCVWGIRQPERGRVLVSHESLQKFPLIFNTGLSGFGKGGRVQTFAMPSPKPPPSNSAAIHVWGDGSSLAGAICCEEQPRLGEPSRREWQDRPGLSVSSVVILKNKKNILTTGILKIKTPFIIHLPRDPLSKKLLMEVLYLAAIQLAKKCSVIHYIIKFSPKKAHFLRL